MNVQKLIKAIGETDPEVFEQSQSRRHIFRNLATRVAALTVPMVAGGRGSSVKAKTTSKLGEGFGLGLRLAHLQKGLYDVGQHSPDLIPTSAQQAVIEKLRDIKMARIELLSDLLDSLGEDKPLIPAIDFTGGYGTGTGPFQKVFTDFEQFLNLSQCLEDLSVRAYKGQMTIFMVHDNFLQTLMRIHSVESRIAAKVRIMRRQLPGASPLLEPWVRGDQSHIKDVFFENFYSGEANQVQMGFAIPDINGMPVSQHAATEAFDEPLPAERVMAVVQKFFAG